MKHRVVIKALCYLGVLFFFQSSILLTSKKSGISEGRLSEIFNDHKDKVFGFDMSHYQGYINWEKATKVRNKVSLKFVFIRATAGVNKKDEMFNHNWKKAKENNLIRGAYHYYRPDEDPVWQAKQFIKNVTLSKGDFPPVLDIEKEAKTIPMKKLKQNLKKWLDIVEAHYGVKPIIYTGDDYHNRFLRQDFEAYKFWVANYNPSVSYLEDDWLIWQFTDTVIIDGIKGPADLNVWHGDYDNMLSYTIK